MDNELLEKFKANASVFGKTAGQIQSDFDRISSPIAVDTLSRQANPDVKRGVEISNNFQSRPVSQGLSSTISSSISKPAPVVERVSEADQNRQVLRQTAEDILGTDLGVERQNIREDLKIKEKEERARLLSDQLTKRDRDMQKQLEKLEKNPLGKGELALDADIARFNRESARELADLSFSYNVALGDYNAAEKIASEYISDLQADLQQKQNAWQMLYNLVQNDMTESEKLQATQAFSEKQMQDQYQLDIKKIQFENNLKQAQVDLGIKAPDIKEINGVSMQWDPVNGVWIPAATTDTGTAEKTNDAISLVKTALADAKDLADAAGPSAITRVTGDIFVGDTRFRRLEQKLNTVKTNVLTMAGDPNIRDFFGPQMSEADVRMMTSAGTTLDAQANSPQDIVKEITRLESLFDRLSYAAQERTPASGAGYVVTAPDGTKVEIID